jgi:hypothetical protein
MTLGELEFLNIYSLEKLYTEVPELQGRPFLSTSRAVTRIGSSLDLFFTERYIQNTFSVASIGKF